MGDLNAKVGADNIGYESVMGTHGVGVMNDKGNRLADFCNENRFVIGGTISRTKHVTK